MTQEMADQNLTLGTLFTANINDFVDKTRRLESILDSYARKAAKTKAAINKLGQAHTKLGQKMDPLDRKIGKVVGAWNRLRAAAKVTAAYGMAATAIFALTNAMRVGLTEIIEYDQAMKNLEAITGATSAELGIMSDEIKRIAVDTKFSTTEIATGMVLLGQAGLSAAEATNAIDAAAMLATGTLSNMQLTTDLLTTALRSFSLDAIESTRIADVMANAINKSKLTIDKLRISFSYVGAVASQANLSLEETAAATMVLANNGLRASTIGTGLRQVLARLLAPNRKIREAYEQQGVSLEKLSPLTAGFQAAIKNLAPVLWDFEKNAVDMSKAFELFGLRGAQAAAIMVKEYTSGNYNRMLEQVFKIGSAADMAAIQAEGLGVKWKNLADRAKVLALEIGEFGVVGAMKALIYVMKGTVEVGLSVLGFMDRMYESAAELIAQKGEEAIAHKRTMSSLEAYKGALESINKKVIEGQDVKGRYLSVLQRMKKDHEDLTVVIDKAALGYENLHLVIEAANEELAKERVGHVVATIGELVLLGNELDRLGKKVDFAKELGLEVWDYIPKRIESITADIEIAAERLAQSYIDITKDAENPLGEALKKLTVIAPALGKNEKVIIAIMDQMIAKANDLGGVSFIPESALNEIKQLPDIFLEVFEKLSAVDKGKFIKSYRALQKEIAADRKTLALEGLGDIVPEVVSAKQLEFLRVFQEKLEKARMDPILKAQRLEKQFLAYRAKLTTDETERLERQRQVDLARLEVLYDKKFALAKKNGEDVNAVYVEYADLQGETDRFYNQKTLDLEREKSRELLEINALQIRAKNAQEQKGNVVTAESTKHLLEIQRSDQIAYYEAIVALEQRWYDDTVKIYGEGHEKTLESKAALLKAIIKLSEFETKVERAEAKKRIDERKKELKAKIKSLKKYSEEWFDIMRELQVLGEGTDFEAAEHSRREKALGGSWFDQLRFGFEESSKDAKTWGEQIIEIGEGMSASFGKAWTSFTSGSRTASEAMADFIKRSIEGLSELIIKQIFYNALVAAMPGFFGTKTTTTASVTPPQGATGVTTLAKGGWIREPIIGRGVRSGKMYTLGEKEAERVTPISQMGGGGDVKVILNNYTGTQMKVRAEGPKFNGAETIMTIWLDAVNRNVFNSRDLIKGLARG